MIPATIQKSPGIRSCNGKDLAKNADELDDAITATRSVNIVETITESETSASITDFYVTPDGDVVPSTGYRYVSENSSYLEEMQSTMTIPGNSNGTYLTFENYDIANPGALQVPHDASVKVSFDTLQIIDDIPVPYGKWGTADYLEPLTQVFPIYGPGGATQAITHSEIAIDSITVLQK